MRYVYIVDMQMDELVLAALPDEVIDRGLARLLGDLALFDAILGLDDPEVEDARAAAAAPPNAA
ncbi:hypothetical protein [Euzebya sp.]|uniref:hypothetical protein n=1 Tax=Euzebya sp. TaxID=1971409 RepID=UPI003516AC0B